MKNSGLASSEARLKMNLPANALITGLSTYNFCFNFSVLIHNLFFLLSRQKDGVKSVGIVKAAQTGSNTEEKEAEQKLITTKPITLK